MNGLKLLIALTVIGGMALAGAAEAFTITPGKWHDPALPVPFRINTFHNEPTVPGNDEFTDLRLSFDNWENVAGARISFAEGPAVTTFSPCTGVIDGQNVLSFRDCAGELPANVLGRTSLAFDIGVDYGQGGIGHLRIYDADIVFSEEVSWITLPAAQQQGCAGRYIIQSVATHEIGHVIGLDHSAVPGATMVTSIGACDQGPASLHQDDISGCLSLYDEFLPTYEIGVHDVNQVRLGVTNCGNVGLPSGAILGNGLSGIGGGAGFQFPVNSNHLFEASLIFAREAVNDTAVSDDYRVSPTGLQDADFLPVTGLQVFTPGLKADQQSFGEFNDSVANLTGAPQFPTPATTPIGISVRTEGYAWSAAADNKYVIMLYRLRNTTGATINDLNVGWIMDVDFTVNFGSNSVAYDAANRLGYVSDPSTVNRIGVRVLNPEGTRSFRALTSSGAGVDNYTNANKAAWLKSGFAQTSLNNRDIGLLICTGPFDIPPGGSAVAAFAFCAGTSLADLQTVSQAAQNKYDTVLANQTAVEENSGVVGPVYALHQNAPNPFNPTTRIAFTMPHETEVSLKVFDLEGRLVRTLLDERRAGGTHEIEWNGRDDAGRRLSSGIYFYELRAGGRLIQSRKMQLLK